MSFSSLGLSEVLINAVQAAGYQEPTAVQQQAIPAVLQGRDLMVAAQTGTGKTGGFALPTLELLFPSGTNPGQRRPRQARVLVLTPTRELATQVHDSFRLYAQGLPLLSACVFGGVGMKPQVQALAEGVDVLVACPGRLLDLAGQSAVDLSGVEILVLDEADRMLDMGFIHDVKKILAKLPAQRQNLLFSATFSSDITQLATKLLHEPQRIEVTPVNTTVERIEQRVYRIAPQQKRALLAHLIRAGNWEQVLVFTRTKHGANRLAEYLAKRDLPSAAIHGNKSQNARTKALAQFKSNEIRILVATDIAARGLDIDQLPHVVNFELPNVEEDYVHRIGRTGRAGRNGEAISLVAPEEDKLLRAIERLTRQQIPLGEVLDFEPEAETHSGAPDEDRQEPRGVRTVRRTSGAKPDEKRRQVNARTPKGREEGSGGATEEAGRRRRNKRKGRNPESESKIASAAALPLPPERDPEEFLDDEYDNFGNRADYVSPASRNSKNRAGHQDKKHPGAKGGSHNGKTANRRSVSFAGNGHESRGRQRKAEAALAPNRSVDAESQGRPSRQPLIVRKGERLPSLEQLKSLDQDRSRKEKPALLGRDS